MNTNAKPGNSTRQWVPAFAGTTSA